MSGSIDFTVFKGNKEGKIYSDTTHKEIQPHDVVIKITHSGVCFTDHHYKQAGCGLGHEGVGIVERVGDAVTTFKVYVSAPTPCLE